MISSSATPAKKKKKRSKSVHHQRSKTVGFDLPDLSNFSSEPVPIKRKKTTNNEYAAPILKPRKRATMDGLFGEGEDSPFDNAEDLASDPIEYKEEMVDDRHVDFKEEMASDPNEYEQHVEQTGELYNE